MNSNSDPHSNSRSHSHSKWIRPTAVAGTFYPKDEVALREMLTRFCAGPAATRRTVRAIVAPHAGYLYSGAIAGEVYRKITVPAKAIIVCPNHYGGGKQISVWSEGEWETPLGNVPVDTELAGVFLQSVGESTGDRQAHLREHANEVHIPFLKFLRDDIQILPVTLGPLSLESCHLVAKAIAATVEAAGGKEKILVIASTDMSHYISAQQATLRDQPALQAIKSVAADGLYRAVVETDISMCGFVPTTAVLSATSTMGATRGEILRYGHSGEISKDFDRVVAYAAAWIV